MAASEHQKEIWRKAAKKYKEAHPDRVHESKKKYRSENKEKKWNHDNKEKINSRRREARRTQSVAEKERARQRAYRIAHPEKKQESDRKYYLSHIDGAKVKARTRRARRIGVGGMFTAQEWIQLKDFYNHTCLCCGKKEPEIKLSHDHVVPLSKGGTNSIENMQPLCLHCNKSKGTKHIEYRTRFIWEAQ